MNTNRIDTLAQMVAAQMRNGTEGEARRVTLKLALACRATPSQATIDAVVARAVQIRNI